VFSKGAPELGAVLAPVASNTLAWNDALSEILKYSLLRRDPHARILGIHHLVKAVLKQGMDEATQRLWAERAVRAVDLALPNSEFSTWALCERLLPQAQACAELISQWNFEFPEATRLLNDAGLYLHERGRYTDAEPLYERAVAIREKTLGAEHPDVANSLNNMAALYSKQGQYAKAEPLFERALAILERALGPEHPNVMTCLGNHVILLLKMWRWKEAAQVIIRSRASIRAKRRLIRNPGDEPGR